MSRGSIREHTRQLPIEGRHSEIMMPPKEEYLDLPHSEDAILTLNPRTDERTFRKRQRKRVIVGSLTPD